MVVKFKEGDIVQVTGWSGFWQGSIHYVTSIEGPYVNTYLKEPHRELTLGSNWAFDQDKLSLFKAKHQRVIKWL